MKKLWLTGLALTASLTFEQSYGGVEGDSASMAELCSLLSALAGAWVMALGAAPVRGARQGGSDERMSVAVEINQTSNAQILGVTGAERGFLVLEEHGELRFDTALDSCRGDIAQPEFEISGSVVRDALAGTGASGANG